MVVLRTFKMDSDLISSEMPIRVPNMQILKTMGFPIFSITVSNVNDLPVFGAIPSQETGADVAYSFTVPVSDEDGDLSVSEIEEAYAEYCSSRKWHPKPNTIVRTDLEQLMLELFQTAKSNSISRHGKSAKGYRKVKLKP